jgi:OmpA family protein
MALSLRRANAVKDALVQNGVPAQAITVIGMGEKGLLVPTADGVREPQNRQGDRAFFGFPKRPGLMPGRFAPSAIRRRERFPSSQH